MFHRRFQNECLVAESRVGENAAKPVKTNIPFADVLVPVHMRSQRRFGIVGMNDGHVLQSQPAVDFPNCLFQSFLCRDVVAGREQVACVQAESEGQIREFARELAHYLELFKPATQLRTRAGCILYQQLEVSAIETMRRLARALENVKDPLLDGMPFVIARMGHQKFRADGYGTLDFAAERLDRVRADAFIRGREVDQVVHMNRQGPKIVPLACPLEELNGRLAQV